MYRFDWVGDERGCLPVGLGEVVREPLVLRLLAAKLHELALHQVCDHLETTNNNQL